MRFFEIIRETAEQDSQATARASDAYRCVAKAVGSNDFFEVELHDGRQFYGFDPVKIGLADVPADLLILVGLRTSNHSVLNGALWTIDGSPWMDKYRLVLVVHGMREFTVAALQSCVHSTGFMETFKHEFIHVLDQQRTQGRITARKPIDPHDRQAYFNDPAEFNAYFHQFADSWLDCLQNAQQHPDDADDYKGLYGITGDFKADLKALIDRSPYSKKYFATLDGPRRKSILRRLYRLHNAIISSDSDNR